MSDDNLSLLVSGLLMSYATSDDNLSPGELFIGVLRHVKWYITLLVRCLLMSHALSDDTFPSPGNNGW